MRCKIILIILSLLVMLSGFACKKAVWVEYKIDRNSCNGCGECIRVCPNDAVYLDSDGKAVIDQTKCTQCAKCVVVCPNKAIY